MSDSTEVQELKIKLAALEALKRERLAAGIPWQPVSTAPVDRVVLVYSDQGHREDDLSYWFAQIDEDKVWFLMDGEQAEPDFKITHWADLTPPDGYPLPVDDMETDDE